MQRDYVMELKELIQSTMEREEKKTKIMQYHEGDIAQALAFLTKEERLELYKILDPQDVSEIFSYLDNVADYVDELSTSSAAKIISLMDSDDAVDVLEELDEDNREDIVALLQPESIQDINLIDQYDDEQIGSKMTNNYILIEKNNTVKSAMKKVISLAAENDNVSTIYVEDESHHFYGAIDLRDLIVARDKDDLGSLMKQNYPFFYATEYVSDCLVRLKDYSLDSYPILNEDNVMIGVVTSDDVVEVVDEELSDDYAKLGGLTEEEELHESVFQSVKKRLPWLIALLFLGLIVSSLISGFEAVVAALPVIVFFQSLILDMAGNTGTQSLAVTIRLLADKEIAAKDLRKAVFKEFRVGVSNGTILAIISFVFVFLFLFITKQTVDIDVYSHLSALKAAGIVAFSLFTAMSVCSLIGSIVPIIFLKIKIDPAVASGPFITTLNDILAILIYYGLAYLLFLM